MFKLNGKEVFKVTRKYFKELNFDKNWIKVDGEINMMTYRKFVQKKF